MLVSNMALHHHQPPPHMYVEEMRNMAFSPTSPPPGHLPPPPLNMAPMVQQHHVSQHQQQQHQPQQVVFVHAAVPQSMQVKAGGASVHSLSTPSPPILRDADTVKLFVGQLPKHLDEEELRPMFEEFGPIYELSVLRDRFSGMHKDLSLCFPICEAALAEEGRGRNTSNDANSLELNVALNCYREIQTNHTRRSV